jgi:hypothetical protein
MLCRHEIRPGRLKKNSSIIIFRLVISLFVRVGNSFFVIPNSEKEHVSLIDSLIPATVVIEDRE